jgi:HEAT repeat protein
MIEIRSLVTQLGGDDQVAAYRARRALGDAVDRSLAPAKSSERDALATALAEELTATVASKDPKVKGPVPKHSAAVRRLVCQYLSEIASETQLPAFAQALQDLEVRDAVRGVLETIPTQNGSSQLVRALATIGLEFRIGVINALGRQRWRDANAALLRLATDSDPEIRLAAVEGLANFPEAANDAAIAAATRTGSKRERVRAQKARVRLVETLRLAGEKGAALTVTQAIVADPMDGPWKTAARRAGGRLKQNRL